MLRYFTIAAALILVGSVSAASAAQIDSEGNYLMDRSKGSTVEQRAHQAPGQFVPVEPRFAAPATRIDAEGNYWTDRSEGVQR